LFVFSSSFVATADGFFFGAGFLAAGYFFGAGFLAAGFLAAGFFFGAGFFGAIIRPKILRLWRSFL
jgi:hypothetical protein